MSINLSSQIRLGVLVHVEDSLMTHLDSGFAQVSNTLIDYPVPFDLEAIVESITDSIFDNDQLQIDVVKIEKQKWVEYVDAKKNFIYSKDLKKFRQSWYVDIKDKNQLDALVVIYNSELNLTLGMSATSVETKKMCFSTFGNETKSRVHLKLKGLVFIDSKIKKFKSINIPTSFLHEELIIQPVPQQYSEENLMDLQMPFSQLIELQIEEMKKTSAYRDMEKEFRRLNAIRKYKAKS